MGAYVDSGIVMRIVEGDASRHAELRGRWDALRGKTTSTLAIAECLVIPFRNRDQSLIDRYELAFSADDLDRVAVSDVIASAAALIRARFNLKIPDSVHVATAIATGCECVLTTDADLLRCNGYEGLTVELVPRTPIHDT
jgi:predicted nucleic acid-binding protein